MSAEYTGGDCPYGGPCIDPGYPSDCLANSHCVSFSSVEERQQFDAQPDKYYFRYDGDKNQELRFKNKNQLRFLLTDLPTPTKNKAEWGTINSVHNPLEFDDA